MNSRRRPLSRFPAAMILWLTGLLVATACQVPVFRFALERWEADAYSLVIVPSGGELSDDEQSVADFLASAGRDQALSANLTVTVDSAQPNETGAARMDLFYPRQIPGMPVRAIWSGTVTMENARRMVDSPVRRELVKRLLAGNSSTWLFLESGNSEKDDQAAREMEGFIQAAQETLKIPDGVVLRSDLPEQPLGLPVDPDDVLHSEVPLKIEFSLIRVARDDPEEEILLAMLENLEDDLGEYAQEPMAFPVFGRGRVLEPLIGRGINRDNFLEHSGYLCGACSCEVKDQNPGLDLLVAANWNAALDGSQVVIDKVLPPLEGLAALTAAATTPFDAAGKGLAPNIGQTQGAMEVSGGVPWQPLALTLGMVVLVITAGSFFLNRKPS